MNAHSLYRPTKFDTGARVRLGYTGWMAANGATGTVVGQRQLFNDRETIFTTIRLDDPTLYGQTGHVHATRHEFELI